MGDEGKIFVGGLHWNTTNEGLKAYFEQFGQVLDINIMRDPTGRSRCFGFVTFADPLVVDIVLQKTHILDKKQIDPKRAIPKDQPHPPAGASHHNILQSQSVQSVPGSSAIAKEENKVFVGGIHIEADVDDIKEVFAKYDDVLETVLMRDRETGRSRGFGFVTFASLEGAQRACVDTDIRIKGRKVEVKMAVPKGKPVPSGKAPSSDTSHAGMTSSSSHADPYAAWAEYYKQYPEYYEAMMKAYSNPAAYAAYYSQYYGSNANNPSTPATPNFYNPPSSAAGGGNMPPASSSYDPAQYAAMMAVMTGQNLSAPSMGSHGELAPSIPNAADENDSSRRGRSRRPVDNRSQSRSNSRTSSKSHSPSRSRSPSRERNRRDKVAKDRSRSRSRERIREREYDRDRRRDREEPLPPRDRERDRYDPRHRDSRDQERGRELHDTYIPEPSPPSSQYYPISEHGYGPQQTHAHDQYYPQSLAYNSGSGGGANDVYRPDFGNPRPSTGRSTGRSYNPYSPH